ncbi:Otogelin [Liparis tanakae]|uniref:Otogelin n=1 Tax=Liparis tanakae TaxID=230148 RepID=A0A4Z2FM50_9TELE|nr:Otogelin [Liparis tanakae]
MSPPMGHNSLTDILRFKDTALASLSEEPCALRCLNGGQCAAWESCDCSLYQATGHRCQTGGFGPSPGFPLPDSCHVPSLGAFEVERFSWKINESFLLDRQDAPDMSLTLKLLLRETLSLPYFIQVSCQSSLKVHNDPDCGSAPYTCHRSVSLFLPWDGELRLHADNVERISQYVLVTQQRGFTLAWEGRGGSVYVKLSPEFVGRTCGLCGNFNADVQDDLKTSYGVLTHDVEMFGNSWVEAEPHEAPCPMVHPGFSSPCAAVEAHVLQVRREESEHEGRRGPSSARETRLCVSWLQEVEDVCAMLLDPPFQSCHDFVSPLSYMASCSNDLCIDPTQPSHGVSWWLGSVTLNVASVSNMSPAATLKLTGVREQTPAAETPMGLIGYRPRSNRPAFPLRPASLGSVQSGPRGEEVCQVFGEYARACAHADHPLHDWRRHIPQCEKQCPPGLQYRECISCCPASCDLERTCIDSKLACLDGCYCPDDLIFEDGGCVAPSDCRCEYRGLFYPSGQTLQEECSSCTCEGGAWNCTAYSCPGECSVTGDMHFHSFDGRLYTFAATCQYVLAKSRNSGKFTVTVQNAPCGAVSHKNKQTNKQTNKETRKQPTKETLFFKVFL